MDAVYQKCGPNKMFVFSLYLPLSFMLFLNMNLSSSCIDFLISNHFKVQINMSFVGIFFFSFFIRWRQFIEIILFLKHFLIFLVVPNRISWQQQNHKIGYPSAIVSGKYIIFPTFFVFRKSDLNDHLQKWWRKRKTRCKKN